MLPAGFDSKKTEIDEAVARGIEEMSAFNEDDLLLQYQKDWVVDESDVSIGEKTRRSGLTWAQACKDALTSSAKKSAGGCDCFYIGSGKDMAVEYIQAAAMWARIFNQAASDVEEDVFEDGPEGEERSIFTYTIKFSSGFKIQALSSNPSNMRGRQGNVTVDEAAFHERLAEIIKAVMAMLMWGYKVRIISTHNGWENLFNELIQAARKGKNGYKVHRITLDDACKQGLYKRICQVRGWQWSQQAEDEWKAKLLKATASEEDAREEFYCEPKQGGGAFLSRMLIESCMHEAPVIRFKGSAEFNAWPEHLRIAEIADWCKENLLPELEKLSESERHCFGEDFARKRDMTVIAPMVVKPNMERKIPFLVELHNVPYKNQEQVLYFVGERLPRLFAGKLDNRGNGGYLAEQAGYKWGDRIEQVDLSQGWYLSHMPKMKAAFEDRTIFVPKHDDVMSDLRAIKVTNGVPKVPEGSTDDSKERHGDAAIAVCLAYAASLEDYVPIESQSTGQTRSAFSHADAFGGGIYNNQIQTDNGFGSVGGGNDFGGF